MRMMERVTEKFESQLDIRSLTKVRTNFAALLRVLFSDEQLLLFRHQRRKAISIDNNSDEDESCSSDSDESSDNHLGDGKSKGKHFATFQKLLDF